MSYWNDKRVVLLGGASLIGSHLAKALIDRGVHNVGIVDDFSSGKLSNFDYLELNQYGNFWWKPKELRTYDAVKWSVEDEDIVFHLAAQHGGRGYVATHDVELYNNLELDTTIFRACADAGVEKVIFSSSACAYPVDLQTKSDDYVYLSEGMIDYKNMRQADGAYGTEKLVGEAMLDAYIEKGYFKGCSTRSFTVYGPLMNESHAIAALIAKILIRQEPFTIWGDGQQIRNFTYVDDNVRGALFAAEHLERGAINIGVEDRITPNYVAGMLFGLLGWHPEKIEHLLDKPVGPRNRVADSTKLKHLGWHPKFSLQDGLTKTIEWYVSTHDVETLKKELERKLTER